MSRKALVHVSDLKSQPIIGERYLVPAILYRSWFVQRNFWVPVLGPAHADEDLGTHFEHFHYDHRFFNVSQRFLGRGRWREIPNYNVAAGKQVVKGPVNRPMTCVKEMPLYPSIPDSVVKHLVPKYAGKKLSCMRCPHRGTPLNGLPVRDGIVQCPAHGLEIEVANLPQGELCLHS